MASETPVAVSGTRASAPEVEKEEEEENDGLAAGLAELPSTVAFFDVPRRQSSGFVLDFGQEEEPPDLSPRRNSTGESLDLITLLSPPPPPQDGARWWKPHSPGGGSTRPSVTAAQDTHGVVHTLSELQLESLAARFHAVPAEEIRRAHEHFCALSLRSSGDGPLAIQRRHLPELLHLIGLPLNLKMGGQASDPFRFRDVIRLLQALRDEEAMMQTPVSPMPAASSAQDQDSVAEDLVMHTNPLFHAIKQQRAPGEPGEGALELSASGAAVLFLPRNTSLQGTTISRQIVEAHIALKCVDSSAGRSDAAVEAEVEGKRTGGVQFETLGGARGLSLDGDTLRIDASSSLPSAGSMIHVLEREQFFDEECKRHEVLWLAEPLTAAARQPSGPADHPTDDAPSLGAGAYTLFDQRSSYQEHMAFLYMFTAPPDSPDTGLRLAVEAAAEIRQAATTLLSAIMERRRNGTATDAGGASGHGRGRRRSLDGIGLALGLGKKLSLTGSVRRSKSKGSDADIAALDEETAAEASLTSRLSRFVHGARTLQMEAAERVARSLVTNSGASGASGGRASASSTAREFNSLRSAVSAFIAAAVHEPVLQVLRRAYEHEDIALAAKLAVWADLSDDELREAGLPDRPPIAPPDSGATNSTYFDLHEASMVLHGLEEGVTPEEQLLTVKRATWAMIIKECTAESSTSTPKKSKTVKSLPADDLLPLFVELLAKATPPYLFSTICYINFFYVPPAPASGGGAAAAAGDELSYHATNLRAAAAIIGLRCPWEKRTRVQLSEQRSAHDVVMPSGGLVAESRDLD